MQRNSAKKQGSQQGGPALLLYAQLHLQRFSCRFFCRDSSDFACNAFQPDPVNRSDMNDKKPRHSF